MHSSSAAVHDPKPWHYVLLSYNYLCLSVWVSFSITFRWKHP